MTRVPLTAVLPDARDRHRATRPSLTVHPPPPRVLVPYVVPGQGVVQIDADVARGAATVTYALADGTIVIAKRAPQPPPPVPAWCQTLAQEILTTVQEWQADGANDPHLIACIADILEQALPEVRR